jgi:hypothetical protein
MRFIKNRIIACIGHVMRMDDKRTPTRILVETYIYENERKTMEEMDCGGH